MGIRSVHNPLPPRLCPSGFIHCEQTAPYRTYAQKGSTSRSEGSFNTSVVAGCCRRYLAKHGKALVLRVISRYITGSCRHAHSPHRTFPGWKRWTWIIQRHWLSYSCQKQEWWNWSVNISHSFIMVHVVPQFLADIWHVRRWLHDSTSVTPSGLPAWHDRLHPCWRVPQIVRHSGPLRVQMQRCPTWFFCRSDSEHLEALWSRW